MTKRKFVDKRVKKDTQILDKNFTDYYNLPKGVKKFSPEQNKRYKFDVIPYRVTNPDHPLVRLRIMEAGEDWDCIFDYWVHRYVGVNNQWILCPKTFGKKCPICEDIDIVKKMDVSDIRERFGSSATEAEREEFIKSIKAQHRTLQNVYFGGVLYIFDESYFLYHERVMKFVKVPEEDGELISLSDPDDVKTVRCSVYPGKLSDKYNDYEINDIYPTKTDVPDKIVDSAPVLDTIFNLLSYDDIKGLYEGADAGYTEKKEKEEEDTTRGRKRSRRESVEESPDKEREEEAIEEDVEEEVIEERTSRKREKKTSERTDKSKAKCPSGFTFGIDFDEHSECDDCEKWFDCKRAVE